MALRSSRSKSACCATFVRLAFRNVLLAAFGDGRATYVKYICALKAVPVSPTKMGPLSFPENGFYRRGC
jgi:hypothetical protein